MNSQQLELDGVRPPNPEERVAEILRAARKRFGNNLQGFYAEIQANIPTRPADDYEELVAVARARREQHARAVSRSSS